MKIKVDENIGRGGADLLRRDNHDVISVHEQGLSGASDEVVFNACVAEDRTLVTLDRDFGQVTRFPPRRSSGIVVLEIGSPASLAAVYARLNDFLALVRQRSVHGELWIVEPGRVRVHLERDQD